jgi:hypothetical protein
MLSNSISRFDQQLTNLCGDRYQLIADLSTSKTYKSTLTAISFSIELSEARVHSRLIREQQPSDYIWQLIVNTSFAQLGVATPLDILFWNNQTLFSSDLSTLRSSEVTQVEISSKVFSIENENLLRNAISDVLDFTEILIDITAENLRTEEGTQVLVTSKRYERSNLLRKIAIGIHGNCCFVCGMNFENVYGEIGRDFIHVHHIERVADKGIRTIDPYADLIPVCPNCHAMLHSSTPPLKPSELKKNLRN